MWCGAWLGSWPYSVALRRPLGSAPTFGSGDSMDIRSHARTGVCGCGIGKVGQSNRKIYRQFHDALSREIARTSPHHPLALPHSIPQFDTHGKMTAKEDVAPPATNQSVTLVPAHARAYTVPLTRSYTIKFSNKPARRVVVLQRMKTRLFFFGKNRIGPK